MNAIQNTIQSNDPLIDTLKCPKCKAIWRAKGYYDPAYGAWQHEGVDDELCPNKCFNFFGFRVHGRVLKRR